MKKLMIAAAIVCAACVSQAASFVWSITTYENVGPTEAYNLPAGDEYAGLLDVSKASMAYIYLGEDLVSSCSADPDEWVWGTYGGVDSPASHDKVNAISSATDTEHLQTFRVLLRTDDGKYEAEKLVTAVIATVEGLGETTYMQQVFVETPFQTGDWKAVPEPTSGLLLLLGVAGLALKRKRA